jgi:hypothetical protein
MVAKRKSDDSGSTAHMKRKIDADEHNDICDRRLGWMKKALYIIVVFLLGGGALGYTQTEGMRTINATQNANIEHNEEAIDKLDEKFDKHLYEQRAVNKEILETLNTLKTDVTVIKRNVQ